MFRRDDDEVLCVIWNDEKGKVKKGKKNCDYGINEGYSRKHQGDKEIG